MVAALTHDHIVAIHQVVVAAELLAVKVTTLLPVVGLVPKDAVTPLGRPEAASVTLPLKLFPSATVTVSVAVLPCVTESEGAEGDNVKPGVPLEAVPTKVVMLCPGSEYVKASFATLTALSDQAAGRTCLVGCHGAHGRARHAEVNARSPAVGVDGHDHTARTMSLI